MYISIFKKNLISIDSLSDQNYKIIFYKKQDINLATIYNSKNNKVYTISSNNCKIYNQT